MRKLAFPAVLMAIAAFAPGARAAGVDLLSPQTGTQLARGSSIDFELTAPGVVSLQVGVAADGRLDSSGKLARVVSSGVAKPISPGVYRWSMPASAVPSQRPGHYEWQAIGYVAGTGAEIRSPLMSFDVAPPSSVQRRGPIPRSLGRHAHVSFYLSDRGLPRGLGGARFRALAKRSGARWGLRAMRFTGDRPGVRDGFNIVGFRGGLTREKLGEMREVVASLYRGGTYIGRRVLDRDILLRPDIPWYFGSGYPPADRFDLESVLLHELGHMAGNHAHQPRCTDSPLTESLGTGEWWHTPRDWFQFNCSLTASRLGRMPAAQPLRLGYRRIVARRIELPAR